MEPTLVLKNKWTKNVAKVFFRVYELILLGVLSSMTINLFFYFPRSVTVVTTFLSFVTWASQSIITKIYPFIYHTLRAFERDFYKYFVKKSVLSFLAPTISYVGFLIVLRLKAVLLILAISIYGRL